MSRAARLNGRETGPSWARREQKNTRGGRKLVQDGEEAAEMGVWQADGEA